MYHPVYAVRLNIQMLYSLVTAAFAAFGFFWWYWTRRPLRRAIAALPGPPSESWLVGNIANFERAEDAADTHFEWTKKYGNAFRVKGCFGEDVLYVSDPKAMQYILNKSGYNYPKTWEVYVIMALITGRGLVNVEGADHARHRRVMNPSFSYSALKGFLPLFFELSRRTASTWTAMIRKQNTEASILDVSSLLARTTLDAIGEAAFGYKFNSIEGVEPKTELHEAYQNLFVDINFMVSDFQIMFRRLLGYAPLWVSDILTSLPKKDLRRLKNYMIVAYNVAKDLVENEMRSYASGKEGGKDILSIFIRANNAEDPKRRLELEEILPQITTLLLAGHETTASSLGWTLYELSKHPEVQRKLRDEIVATRKNVASRGESEITISDLESMKYMVAIIKETLRFHPIVPQLFRRAAYDDVIPLDTAQQTTDGDTITSIPIRQGQVVHLGLAPYNRLQSIWGHDADEWRPERFLGELPKEQKANLIGVFGNISTFSSGLRSCIGWRFAVIQMQAILMELIDHFAFSPAPNVEIRRAASGLMQSMVKGEEHKGTQLPLIVSLISTHNQD